MRPRELTIEKLQEKVKDNQFTILERLQNPNYVLIRFTECGHEKQLPIASIKRNTVARCSDCNESRFKEEAQSKGLVLLDKIDTGKSSDVDYRRYMQKCGHERILKLCDVRKNGGGRCYQCVDDENQLLVENSENSLFKYIGKLKGLNGKSTLLVKCKIATMNLQCNLLI